MRLHRARLDHQIADGCPPDAIEDRALRAAQLVDMATRRRVAGSLRRIVRDSERPAISRLSAAAPIRRREIWPWREGLLGLADRLERPGPVDPCGVARALELFTDGCGPLYHPGAARTMGEAVWWIADGLQPGPDA